MSHILPARVVRPMLVRDAMSTTVLLVGVVQASREVAGVISRRDIVRAWSQQHTPAPA